MGRPRPQEDHAQGVDHAPLDHTCACTTPLCAAPPTPGIGHAPLGWAGSGLGGETEAQIWGGGEGNGGEWAGPGRGQGSGAMP